jgi:trigger factor
VRRAGQAGQARERALDALLDRVDIPLPEDLVDREIASRHQSLDDRLERSGNTMEEYLEAVGSTAEQLDQQLADDARRSVKAGFILDKLAAQEELGVSQEELAAYVTEQAYRMGVPPDRLAKELGDRGQLAAVAADVLRGKALTLLAERARVTDESGHEVDLKADEQAAGEILEEADVEALEETDVEAPAAADDAADEDHDAADEDDDAIAEDAAGDGDTGAGDDPEPAS